jgi:hypothetical protein
MSAASSSVPSIPTEQEEVRFQISFFKEHLADLRVARTKKNKKGFVVIPANTPAAWKKYFSKKSLSNGTKVYQSWITSMQKEKGMPDKEKADALCVAMKNAYAELSLKPKYELSVKKITGKVKEK